MEKENERKREKERGGEIERGRKAIRASKRKTKVQLKVNEERSNVGKAEFSGRLTITQMDRFLNSSLHRSMISLAKHKRKLSGSRFTIPYDPGSYDRRREEL